MMTVKRRYEGIPIKDRPMSPNEFYNEWRPCDWPAIGPDRATEKRFKRDLRRVGLWYEEKWSGKYMGIAGPGPFKAKKDLVY